VSARLEHLLAFALLAASVSRSVVAGPPLVTDDPETPGRGGWEVNLSHTIESTREAFLMELPLVDINYGFQDNDQFKVEFAVVSLDPAEGNHHWGVSDLLVGYKYRFLEEDQAGLMASFYPQLAVPTGNRHVAIGSGSTELLVPFQAARHFCDDRLLVYAELGYHLVFDAPERNRWKYGVAAQWQLREGLEVMGEVGGFACPQRGEPDDVFFNLGLAWTLTEHAALISSAGRSFRDGRHGTPEFTSFVGVQLTWGGGKDRER
jgi:hypothetical protein